MYSMQIGVRASQPTIAIGRFADRTQEVCKAAVDPKRLAQRRIELRRPQVHTFSPCYYTEYDPFAASPCLAFPTA